MAVSFARFGRFLRSIFAPTAAIFGFSCLLTFIFVLYQPHPGLVSHRGKVFVNTVALVTENCRRVKGLWNCFGGGGSYSGYSKVGFDQDYPNVEAH